MDVITAPSTAAHGAIKGSGGEAMIQPIMWKIVPIIRFISDGCGGEFPGPSVRLFRP
jgi:hypothetical protein